ncbi:MAG: hypothetical protein HKN11_04440 [Rhizobiales bacterium]|nr:hypothetical protein [Hyphomicrobiales bacterium]
MAFGAISDWGVKFELTIGVAFFVTAMGVAATVFQGIRSQKLPFFAWYALPVIIGIGFAMLGSYNLDDWLRGVGGAILGFAAFLISFAVLRFWADSKGDRGWAGIIVLGTIAGAGGIFGATQYFAQ